jgi:hypothetical protein
MQIVRCPEYTTHDAYARWGIPGADRVERACPWCASWLFPVQDEKIAGQEKLFGVLAECRNLTCPMLKDGGAYWEPLPDGWTDENKTKWIKRTEGTSWNN